MLYHQVRNAYNLGFSNFRKERIIEAKLQLATEPSWASWLVLIDCNSQWSVNCPSIHLFIIYPYVHPSIHSFIHPYLLGVDSVSSVLRRHEDSWSEYGLWSQTDVAQILDAPLTS